MRDLAQRLLGGAADRERPLRVLRLLAPLLCLPAAIFAVVLVVDDLRSRTDEMDGFGVVFGVVLLLWVGVPLLLVALAWWLRARPVASAVLAVLGGLMTLWVGTAGLAFFPLPDVLQVVVGLLWTLLAVAAAALGVLVAVRTARGSRAVPAR